MAVSPWLQRRQPLDRLVALVLAAALAPVIAALALAVRLRDGSPAIIRLERAGQGFSPLRLLKLRTMRAAEPGGRAGGPALTSGADPRITPLGAQLRRWRADELPQLWHVLRGEMLLIGPRPEDPVYVDRDSESWTRILAVPPGLAGATQLLVQDWEALVLDDATSDAVYRDRVLPAKVALDAWYVEHASPHVDLWIVRSLVERFAGNRRSTTLHRKVDLDSIIGESAAAEVRAAAAG